MVPNANARHFRIKAAQRDLIAAAGGIQRAADLCNYGKSTVGRWADIESREWMALDAVDKLEAETGLKLFTVAWVETRGLKLDSEERESRVACLTSEMAGFILDFGTMLGEWGVTSADGHATPAEAQRLRSMMGPLRERFGRIEDVLATVKADGGLSLVKGGAA